MDIDRLRELFSYDPSTGELRRKNTGRVCGTRHSKTRVKTPEGQMYAHRVAFALVYGWLPAATSRFKGVHFEKQTQKWRAQIKVNGRKLLLGRFESELDAVRAYDAAAERHHGEFARVNGV